MSLVSNVRAFSFVSVLGFSPLVRHVVHVFVFKKYQKSNQKCTYATTKKTKRTKQKKKKPVHVYTHDIKTTYVNVKCTV